MALYYAEGHGEGNGTCQFFFSWKVLPVNSSLGHILRWPSSLPTVPEAFFIMLFLCMLPLEVVQCPWKSLRLVTFTTPVFKAPVAVRTHDFWVLLLSKPVVLGLRTPSPTRVLSSVLVCLSSFFTTMAPCPLQQPQCVSLPSCVSSLPAFFDMASYFTFSCGVSSASLQIDSWGI